jgi:serine/threonine-protein kinase RsbW
MKNRQQLQVRFSTSPEMSRGVFELINKCLDGLKITDDVKRKFMLAVGEAIDNAVIHGNKFSPAKFIEVEYTYEMGKITVTVKDEGNGFDFTRHLEIPLIEFEAPKLIEKTVKYGSPGGLGLALMRKCINELIFTPPGNKITLIKHLVENS